MEKFICEVCGGEIIENENGAFECQSCGKTYSEQDLSALPAEDVEAAEEAQTEQPAESGADGKAKKTDKTIAIVTLCGIVLAFIIGITTASFSGNRAAPSTETEYDNPVYTDATTTEATESDCEYEDDEYETQMTESEFEDMIEEQLDELDYVEVGFHEGNVFSVGFAFDGTAAEVGKIRYGIADRSFWNTTKTFVNDLYKKIKNLADIYGFGDYSIGINVINDMDHSKSLLVLLNGTIVYDCLS